MACSCIDMINGSLVLDGARIEAVTVPLSGEATRVVVPTVRIEKVHGTPKRGFLLPTYCPFCGRRYSR